MNWKKYNSIEIKKNKKDVYIFYYENIFLSKMHSENKIKR